MHDLTSLELLCFMNVQQWSLKPAAETEIWEIL